MKLPVAAILLLINLYANAQKIEKFLDYTDKETDVSNARYYVNIEKTGSGWQRKNYFIRERKLQMAGVYEDSSCQVPLGKFSYFHSNGLLKSSGDFIEGKKEGLWISYYNNGMTSDSTVYKKGNPVGTYLKWHRNGFVSDSAVLNEDGSGVEVTWFDTGSPSSAGRYCSGHYQNGKWQYFHKNGKISAEEIYKNGWLVDRKYFDENGDLQPDTTNKDRTFEFPGGVEAWHKYLHKKGYFPPQYRITNADSVIVVVDAVIDENGKVGDVEIIVPFESAFDNIVKRVVQKSPDWIPAIDHNRKVKSFIRQSIAFIENKR